MNPTRRGLLVAVGIAIISAVASGQKGITEKYNAGVKELIGGLTELGKWAESQKLFKERNKLCELVLVFDPDDATARATLGFEKKAGAWVKSGGPKQSGNVSTDPMKDFNARRSEVTEKFLAAMDKLLDDERRMIDGSLRNRIASDMAAVDREDPRARKAGGEAQVGGKWVLVETATAIRRRKEILGFAKGAISGAGQATKIEPDDIEVQAGVPWTDVVRTKNVRALGTGEKGEASRIAIDCEAAGELFRQAFEETVTHKFDYTILSASSTAVRDTILSKWPGVDDKFRNANKGLGGFDLPGGSHVVTSAPDPAARLDGAVRQTLSTFMHSAFSIGSKQGAVFEGIGLYLTFHITGTRLTWFIGPKKYASSGEDILREKLHKPDADWLHEAKTLLAKADHPPLKSTLAHDVNELSAEEIVYGYLLAAYLIEGRPDDGPRFLRALGRSTPSDKASEDAFGVNVEGLEARVLRFARELP